MEKNDLVGGLGKVVCNWFWNNGSGKAGAKEKGLRLLL